MNTMRTLRILGLFFLMLSGVSVYNKTQAQPGVSISFQTFYNDLAPYGRWVRNPQFGSVWIPDVANGFQPYSTNGYWEVTEYGNTWVSDYDWGWAPFHYGRWSYDDYNGWFWVPDYEWGPAWVNWRSGGGYYGWAPLGPGVNINVSINIPSFWWVFVPQRYITNPRWNNYCAPRGRVTHVYNQTVIVNNYYRSNNRTYVYGPRRDEIERVTRRSVPVRTIDASPRGRGRVIVAESGRGNDRYDSRDNGRRDEPSRRGSVIDAGSDRGRGNADNNSNRERNDRNSNGRIGDNSNSDARRDNPSNERSRDAQRNSSEERDNSRINRNRDAESPSPSDSRNNRYEAPRQPDRSRESSAPTYEPERNSRSNRSAEQVNPGRDRGSYEAPRQPERSRESSVPSAPRNERVERSAPERSQPESRGNSQNNRSSQESHDRGGRGASERSSRSPR
ncbi:MAG: DUF6600 domain-containing protein [Dyadobacter sp.]|uniref:DUF6600 domain-containing protein n=1 Tax=Dyadobacter sp. TaxID=1914288 RepID=UPI003265DE4B